MKSGFVSPTFRAGLRPGGVPAAEIRVENLEIAQAGRYC